MRRELASLLLLAGAASAARANETWTAVTTRNFTVVSNAGEGTARSTAAEFEQARAAYGRIWPWVLTTRIKPAVVLALKDEATLRRWAPGWYEARGAMSWASGWAEGADRLYLLQRTDANPDDPEVTPSYNLYRGYLRVLLTMAVERPFPEWLSSGLAGVLANVSVHDKQVLLGRAVPWELQQFNSHGRWPLQSVLDVGSDSPLLGKELERAQFDAQSYVLVHYLLFGDPGGSRKLDRFERLWLKGAAQEDAFREAFGEVKALEAALPTYAGRRVLQFATYAAAVKIASERPPARILAPAEVAGLRAAVHAALNRPAEAEAAIRESRTADPSLAASYDAEGVLADREGDRPRAKQAYARAVDLGSLSPYSHYRTALLAWTAQPEAATLVSMRRWLERAIELDHDYAPACSSLAEVLLEQDDPKAALGPAQRAVALQPGSSYHRLALARVLRRLGRTDEARDAAQQALRLAGDDAERLAAERLLRDVDRAAGVAGVRPAQDGTGDLATRCEEGDAQACKKVLPGLERSCDAKRTAACWALASLYREGRGVPRDPAKAVGLLERGCTLGSKTACVEHAGALLGGEGVQRDPGKAMAELEAVCSSGFFPGCRRLAAALADSPEPSDRQRARDVLARACEGGDESSCSTEPPR